MGPLIPGRIESTLGLLEAIESAEYGSGSGSGAPAIIKTAERLIPRLARQLAAE